MSRYCDHIGIYTSNPDLLIDFYCSRLDFSLSRDIVLPSSITEPIFGLCDDCRLIKLELENTVIELFVPVNTPLEQKNDIRPGYNHWGFSVGDRMTYVEELRKKGIPVIEVNVGTHPVFFIKDPEGNRIEIRD